MKKIEEILDYTFLEIRVSSYLIALGILLVIICAVKFPFITIKILALYLFFIIAIMIDNIQDSI